jgi:hypothetical protein
MNRLKNHSKSAAWILCAIIVLASIVQTFITVSAYKEPPSIADIRETIFWGLALPVVFSILAALIISQQPNNRIGWLLMLPAITVVIPGGNYLSTPQSELTPSLWLRLWLDSWSWIPIIFPIFLIPLHFPTGRPPTKRWNWLNILALAMWIIFMILVAIDDTIGPLNYDWRLSNPLGSLPLDIVWKIFEPLWAVGLAILAIGCFLSLVVRYRRAITIERQQIKWLFFAAAIFTAVYVVLLFLQNNVDLSEGAFSLLLPLSILTFPAAIAIAILRYRLFDIDIIIRKTIVYGLVSALLLLVYFGSVILLQDLFENVSGEKSALSIVISTLLIAALFSPLRRRIQEVIDRRFYRRKYNAQQVITRFAQTANDETDLYQLGESLLDAVNETLRPEIASIWLISNLDRGEIKR